MDLDLQTKPLRVRLVHKEGERRARYAFYRPFALPDSLYRAAARRVIAGLLAQNARQRGRIAALEARLAAHRRMP